MQTRSVAVLLGLLLFGCERSSMRARSGVGLPEVNSSPVANPAPISSANPAPSSGTNPAPISAASSNPPASPAPDERPAPATSSISPASPVPDSNPKANLNRKAADMTQPSHRYTNRLAG